MFELWPGTLCCVVGQDALTITETLSTQVHLQMGTGGFNLRGNPAMD